MAENETEGKKEQVLAAALRLFNKNGFERTPTSAITREAGVATGTLFHHFGSKEALINALYLRCKDSLVESALEGLDRELPYRERFALVYANMLSWVLSHEEEYRFFRQFSSTSYISSETREAGRGRFAPIVDCLAEGSEEGLFKKAPTAYLFELSAAHLMAAAEYILAHPEESDGFPALSFELLWDGLKK